MVTIATLLDSGDLNKVPSIIKACKLGSLLAAEGGLRVVTEVVAVTSDAATPTYTIKRLLSCKVASGATGNGEKTASANGNTAMRTVRETVAVASAAATPTFPILNLLYAKTIGTGAAGVQKCLNDGDTPVRTIRESALAVASAAATPTYPIVQLLYAKTAGTGAPAVKISDINGATPGAGHAAPVANGTSLTFHAETTGTGTADVIYTTLGGVAVPNAGGASVAFGADTTGTGTVDMIYDTAAGTAAANSGGTSIAFYAGEITGANAVATLTYLTSDKVTGAVSALTDNETTIGIY